MNDFDSHDRRGGRRFGRDSRRGGSWGRDKTRTMFKAVCANCSKPCEVPFNPSGDRPVYCNDCFGKMGGKGDGGPHGGDRRNFERPRFPVSQTGGGGQTSGEMLDQLKSMNVKLDKIVGLLENQAVQTPAVKIRSPKKKAIEKDTEESPSASE